MKSRARTPLSFPAALDGWMRPWVRWMLPEEARNRIKKIFGVCAPRLKQDCTKQLWGLKLLEKNVLSHQSTAIARADTLVFFRGAPLLTTY
jgi:hypothetical protein